ncbi:MAG TPA: lactonase family protein [Blastocatellia bacterium]|nr:lactonase family protein [Blastocatellia bacterium]
MMDWSGHELLLYVGTYTSGKSEGIYLYRFNLATGALRRLRTFGGVVNPSFLAIDPRRRALYAVNEVSEMNGQAGGAVTAFAINRQSGELTRLNNQASMGGAPCHLSLDGTGKWLLVANYESGNVAVLPVRRDGSLGAATDVAQHKGSSVNQERQQGPHAHCVAFDAANRRAFAVDLGLDKIMIYRFDAGRGTLTPNRVPWARVKPGAGPRHLTFHPTGRYAYVINELDSTITVFAYDPVRGTLGAVQTLSTLPSDFTGTSFCAEVQVSPSGKFLYGSNRGHDSIVVMAIDERTGKLRPVQHEPTRGKTPRHFTIDPTGAYLLAANQNSDTIHSFRIDAREGKLTPTGHTAEVPSPVCLRLTPASA